MKERYRIVNKEHYVFVERNGQDYMYKVIRPEIQMRVLLLLLDNNKEVYML